MASTSRQRRLAFCLVLQFLGLLKCRKGQKAHKLQWKGRPWVLKHLQLRNLHGPCAMTMQTLRLNHPAKFATYARMLIHIFDWLLFLVTPLIKKMDTNYRLAITPHDRLYICLHFLGFGDSYRLMEVKFLVAVSTIGRFIPEVCNAIIAVLKDKYLKSSASPSEWQNVTDAFLKKWQLPNCLGALDGKHVQISPTKNSVSEFYNYKHTFSVVIMALVDADYKFLFVDVGCNGRVSDGGVYRGTSLQKALERRSSMFPSPKPCPGDEKPLSYYVIADDAFGLAEYLMKPFSYREITKERRIFNYRLSIGRRVVENAFSILANKWSIFLKRIPLQQSTIEKLVRACCAMHNMLPETVGINSMDIEVEDESGDVNPVAWRTDVALQQAPFPSGTNVTARARSQREYLVAYFSSPVGAIPWQDAMILQHNRQQ